MSDSISCYGTQSGVEEHALLLPTMVGTGYAIPTLRMLSTLEIASSGAVDWTNWLDQDSVARWAWSVQQAMADRTNRP